MREEITTHPLFEEPIVLPSGSTWLNELVLSIKPYRGIGIPVWLLGLAYGEIGIISKSTYVYLGLVDNKTSDIRDKPTGVPRIFSREEAYELALDNLRKIEAKWDEYAKEEARYLEYFEDEEEDND